MKTQAKALPVAIAVAAGICSSSNAFALASKNQNVNRWWHGCVPYTVTNSGAIFQSDIEAAVAKWNSVNPDLLYIYPKGQAAGTRCENAPDGHLQFSRQDYLGCGFTNNSADYGYPLAEYNGGTRSITLVNIQLTGKWWPLTEPGCMHKTKPEKARVHIVMHEIGHALGFVHEHQRSDASQYRELLSQNTTITTELSSDPLNGFLLSSYDFYSIMHYASTAAGNKNPDGTRKTTLLFIGKTEQEVAEIDYWLTQEAELSQQDIAGAQSFYGAGKADMSATLSKTGGCSLTRYNNGTCDTGMVPHQVQLSARITNHGPYDSSATQVVFRLPSDTSSSISLTSGQSCNISGTTVTCNIAGMEPFASETYTFDVILNNDSFHDYNVDVSSATDDLSTNNSVTSRFDSKT